jgi:hypothetical protein
MSENIDGAGRRSPGPRLLVRPLLLFASVALVIGFVASRTDVEPCKFARNNDPLRGDFRVQ